MSKAIKCFCVICGHGRDEDDEPSILKIRKGLKENGEPCFICPACDSFFQPVSNETNCKIVDLLNNTELHRLFHRCIRFTRLVALNAPKVVLANELRMTITRASSVNGLDLFEDLKRVLFSNDSYSTFTESQTVDLITAAELSLKKKK